ncbi:hypothetical protein GCM10007301_22520 [Azorhizobium oxalatiphilum]|uniref:Uncharacterized protein n=1 Tax=Azorhizobium oxalatiphilum TaxID=980631 RepID=A0A917C004_9HYPH|nr:hypothetical protein GCM10007301_22520 [Azorhizobium oxalatiphilum]
MGLLPGVVGRIDTDPLRRRGFGKACQTVSGGNFEENFATRGEPLRSQGHAGAVTATQLEKQAGRNRLRDFWINCHLEPPGQLAAYTSYSCAGVSRMQGKPAAAHTKAGTYGGMGNLRAFAFCSKGTVTSVQA